MSWWTNKWKEREALVRDRFGESVPANSVISYSWPKDEVLLPGACCVQFPPNQVINSWLSMSIGLTQPLDQNTPGRKWEFCILTDGLEQWPTELIYQIMLHFLKSNDPIENGYWLPVEFHFNLNKDIVANLSNEASALGHMSGIYLWENLDIPDFLPSTGAFRLMTIIPATKSEDRLSQETSPAHLILLFRQLNLKLVADPTRPDILALPGSNELWSRIKNMHLNKVLHELKR